MGTKSPPMISDREAQAEIKKSLIKFAEEEFAAKKPIELRVIHLKPQTVFQKGSVFPSLVIKTLKRSHYVIFIDYGEEIRFYFYDGNGQSLGASTLPKSPKILNEMHGKGTTFLKLPRPDPTKGLDLLTMELSTRWKDLALMWGRTLGLTPEKQLPISVVSYSTPVVRFRLGINSDKQKLHFDKVFLKTDLQDLILQRELFANFCGLDAENPIVQWLATVWTFCSNDQKIVQSYFNKISLTTSESLIVQKGIEWIRVVLEKELSVYIDKYQNLGNTILLICRFLSSNKELRDFKLWLLLPLWIMKYGRVGADIIAQPSVEDKFIYEIFRFLYQNRQLWTNYHLELDSTYNSIGGWFQYLAAAFFLKKDDQVLTYPGNMQGFSHSADLIHSLRTLKLLDFQKQIPIEFLLSNQNIIKKLIYGLLLERALLVEIPKNINAPGNSDFLFQLQIRNTADWIFTDAEFRLSWAPENRMSVRILNPSTSKFFDIERKLDIKIIPLNPGKVKLELELYFQDPMNHQQRDHLILWQHHLEFEKNGEDLTTKKIE